MLLLRKGKYGYMEIEIIQFVIHWDTEVTNNIKIYENIC